MIFLVTRRDRHGVTQWWCRIDRDFYYRRRADAIHHRNGVSGYRMALHGRR